MKENKIQWNHILDKQPDNGTVIIQIDAPYEFYKGDFTKHYSMGMRKNNDYGLPFSEYLDWLKKNHANPPNYWWIYAKDFPFPVDE